MHNFNLILTGLNKYYNHLHFKYEETDIESSNIFTKLMQLVNGGTEIQTQAVWF